MSAFAPHNQAAAPPILPPKTGSHDTSRVGTPSGAGQQGESYDPRAGPQGAFAVPPAPPTVPDPGETWLPRVLEDKS